MSRAPSVGFPIGALAVCAVGLAISGLSTRDHVRFRTSGGVQAGACAALVESGCGEAHRSPAAEILGVPISHLGSGFYLAGAGLAVLALARRRRAGAAFSAAVAQTLGLMGLGAVGYSVYLATLLIRSGEACPFCIALYAVNATLLALALVWWLRGQRKIAPRPLVVPFAVAAGLGIAFLAITTPLLLRAMSRVPPPALAGATNPGGKPLEHFVLPSRIPSKGPSAPEDDLVEFSDLECPHCASLHQTVASLVGSPEAAGVRVRFVHFPLDAACNPHVARSLHPTACRAARAAICAQEQGLFWPFVDRYYAVRPPRSEQTALDVARDVGADVQRLAACIESDETSRILSEDIALGRSAGVRATPTLLVNGWTFEGALPRARLVEILHDTGPRGCDRRGPDGFCGGEPRN